MAKSLLILGATARAAAQSACRAGLRPLAVDVFGDQDLHATCPARQIHDFPQGLAEAAREFDACPWIYTGALENYPKLLTDIDAERPLLGNLGPTVRRLRDPRHLARALQVEGLLFPESLHFDAPRPRGEWLWKPFRSGGGLGIVADGASKSNDESGPNQAHPELGGDDDRAGHHRLGKTRPRRYRQRRIRGDALSAVFVGAQRAARPLGVTRQLVGSGWAGARGFQYAGSIGPVSLSSPVRHELERLGTHLAKEFELTGLFGVDLILNRQGLWTIEVNPRYSASVEILERSLNIPTLRWHWAACREGELPGEEPSRTGEFWGKAIVYARARVRISSSFRTFVTRTNAQSSWPLVADIPKEGSEVAAGHPITTVFAAGKTPERVEQELQSRTNRVYRSLI